MQFIKITQSDKEKFSIKKPDTYIFYLNNYSGNVIINILCSKAKVYIFGLYNGTKEDKFKLHTTQHHHAGDSVSDLFIKGVFYDSSKFHYEGLIKIDKNAQKSNAYQKNQNVIMSDKVYVDSRPYLEIEANDVRCTHGSTTGRLNEEELFYLQTRGFDIIGAKKLLIQGFKEEIYQRMRDLGVEPHQIPYEIETLS